MTFNKQIVAIIPARSGSKSLPHKNIAPFCGKPLIAHTIEQALACKEIDRTIVTTDSEYYASIAREYGAETPFIRPATLAGDESTDLDVFQHTLEMLNDSQVGFPGLCVHLRPTFPNRNQADISAAIRLLNENPSWDAVRSVSKAPDPPFKMWFLSEQNTLVPAVTTSIKEAHSLPRQILPVAYLQNACVDVIRSCTILQKHSMVGDVTGAFIMSENHDIDNAQQFHTAEASFRWTEEMPRGKTFCFDIDGVIASLIPDNDYSKATPLVDNIKRLIHLHRAGNKIVLHTARGSQTGIDWTELTIRQMSMWGVPYDSLTFGKPAANYYIDDKMLNISQLSLIDQCAE